MSASAAVAGEEDAKQRSIIQMNAAEAKVFLLKKESYCSLDLPPYFQFDKLIQNVGTELDGKNLSDLRGENPRNFEGVNYTLLSNKDGRHSWRPVQLIHPALYVSLVSQLTEEEHWDRIRQRFAEFGEIETIKCLSLPGQSLTKQTDTGEQVAHWWHDVEQRSIELALDYEYLVHADISDCYGAIYTHSVAWGVHGKDTAKKNRSCMKLIGNVIDNHIQDMRHGQTNGIPQGSALMDFVAEMVLGYADLDLAKRINTQGCSDHLILRYRDDYRIFTNNSQDAERILKCLTEVLVGLGLQLNSSKTAVSNLVIRDSIKTDKLAWIRANQFDKNLQKRLLIIHAHGLTFPNAGSLVVALTDFYRRVSRIESIARPLPLISIVVDIAYRNPRAYPFCAAILSRLLSFLGPEQNKSVIDKIAKRFSQLPNTGYMEIWLQRISISDLHGQNFEERLCKLAQGKSVELWNSAWIAANDLKRALDTTQIFDQEHADALSPIIPLEEVELFRSIAEYCR